MRKATIQHTGRLPLFAIDARLEFDCEGEDLENQR